MTDKTPVDHVYSWVTGKNCSIIRKNRGETYCAEDEVISLIRVHCYPTLGEVTCYTAPDPFPGGQLKLGSAAPALVPASVATQAILPVPSSPVTTSALDPGGAGIAATAMLPASPPPASAVTAGQATAAGAPSAR